jgi:glutathione S-transferase
LIFSYAGISFKDKRIKEDEWNKIKDQISFEELPILRVNNQFRIYHLHAIIHYLAREFHLYGTGKHDHAVVDIILETIRPLQEKILEQSKNSEENSHALLIDSSTIYLKQLEKCYEIFHHHGPFYLGSQISLADLIVYDTINYLIKIDRKLLENYSHLKEARRRLEKNPRIINYINTKTYQQIKKSPLTQRHRTKSPTPNLTSHHHRHRSHDEHRLHHHHHHHHHHRRHSKEPTPFSQTKRSIRSSKSPSVAKKEKESTDAIPSSPPITTEEKSESTVH